MECPANETLKKCFWERLKDFAAIYDWCFSAHRRRFQAKKHDLARMRSQIGILIVKRQQVRRALCRNTAEGFKDVLRSPHSDEVVERMI